MKHCQSKNTFSHTPLVLALAAAYACVPAAYGKESTAEKTLPSVQVIGGEEKLPTLGGAGQILGKKELEDTHVFTVNEALRKVAGVHARDEEGFGLRPNIAMRGLNPTRSTKITLLEDGLPLAYAPYGDNASYYHPIGPLRAHRSAQRRKFADVRTANRRRRRELHYSGTTPSLRGLRPGDCFSHTPLASHRRDFPQAASQND